MSNTSNKKQMPRSVLGALIDQLDPSCLEAAKRNKTTVATLFVLAIAHVKNEALTENRQKDITAFIERKDVAAVIPNHFFEVVARDLFAYVRSQKKVNFRGMLHVTHCKLLEDVLTGIEQDYKAISDYLQKQAEERAAAKQERKHKGNKRERNRRAVSQ